MFATSFMAQTCTAHRAAAHPPWDDNTPIGSDYPVWNEFTLQGDYHRPLANAAARAGAAKWIRQI